MTNILIRPNQVRLVADNLRQRAKAIHDCMESVDGIILGLPKGFEGHRSQDLIKRYCGSRNQLSSNWKLIIYYANELDAIADRFEAADRKLGSHSSKTLTDVILKIVREGLHYLPAPLYLIDYLKNQIEGIRIWPEKFPHLPFQLPDFWPPKFPNLPNLLPNIILPDWLTGKNDPPYIPFDFNLPMPPNGATTPDTHSVTPDQLGDGSNEVSLMHDPQKSIDIINSLDVTHASKYQAGDGKTYCNIFASDYAESMGAPLPKFLDWNGDKKIDRYLNANLMVEWLKGDFSEGGSAVKQGPDLGWHSVGADEAAKLANQGSVVLAGWINPAGTWTAGHMAVVRPESVPGDIHIAQAGGSNFENGPVSQGFGNREVEYFTYSPNNTVSF